MRKPERSADYVLRCVAEFGPFRCDREMGHTGKHKAKKDTLTATWQQGGRRDRSVRDQEIALAAMREEAALIDGPESA